MTAAAPTTALAAPLAWAGVVSLLGAWAGADLLGTMVVAADWVLVTVLLIVTVESFSLGEALGVSAALGDSLGV